MTDKKVELNEENLEGVAGGVGDVNVDTDIDVDTTKKDNNSSSEDAKNVNSTVNTTKRDITNTNTDSIQKIGMQGNGNKVDGKIKMS